jgi:hypothetical protein
MPHYRREAFEAGIIAAGLTPCPQDHPVKFTPDDVLIIWNRYGQNQNDADKLESIGGKIIVVENGYMGKDKNGIQYYAMAMGEHNGAGGIPYDGHDRLKELNIEFKPWRSNGNHIVVRAQRGIGSRITASPKGWAEGVVSKLKKYTDRPIVLRPHPRDDKELNLDRDLNGAHALVVWGSSEAGRALIRGIPVCYQAPYHILAGAMSRDLKNIDNIGTCFNRHAAFSKMAWAQWSVDEISKGIPFQYLMGDLKSDSLLLRHAR